jgi:hypothetical protein
MANGIPTENIDGFDVNSFSFRPKNVRYLKNIRASIFSMITADKSIFDLYGTPLHKNFTAQ